ncbi:MAG: DUF5696 domain-containing protein [Kiritimatiellae bacterium]|nr:DUF5696 domain-containing protein [Kiritimatiellia bacterium]MDD5523308.1 DUF5696 domain-containing protein [Kiritimatiellia bacterium]
MRWLYLTMFVCVCACRVMAAQVELTYTFNDKHEEKKAITVEPDAKGILTVTIKRQEIPHGVEYVAVLPDFARAKVGEDGYYVTPDGFMGTFRLQKGSCTVNGPGGFYGRNFMPIYGMKNPRATFVGIVATMRFEYDLHLLVKDGIYTIAPRFHVSGFVPPDDIVIHYHMLSGKDANYAGMARAYRNYQLARGVCKPIKERMKTHPELAYAAKSMEVRVRQGWKPAPSPVLEQTLETEPPMKAVVTFERVGDILDAFKKAGIKRAEICLVGWNQKGHDGRWPQIFPVEEALGGEAKLRALIKKAKRMGYQIVGHTNSSDGYSIAECWDWDLAVKRADGKPFSNAVWSGGQMYALCPQRSYERFYPQDIQKVADLGFRGLHYIDVITILQPPRCQDPNHPCTPKESAVWFDRILQSCKDHIGGVSSEGAFDFACGNLDYVLYVYFSGLSGKKNLLHDRLIPIWQLVYNGIILSNPFTETVNTAAKDQQTQLKLVEFNGRPIYYFYSRFKADNKNWMGNTDLTCATNEELKQAVEFVRKGYEEFETLANLQLEFMEQHDMLAPEVFRTAFSDGSEIITNYGIEVYPYKGKTVYPMQYCLFR